MKSNPVLRQRSSFEDITDSIAQRYGLEIEEQVYSGRVLLAGFSLPQGTDGPALLEDLRGTYASWVSSADFSQLYSAAFSPDDPEYVSSDDSSGGQWSLKHMDFEAAWEHGLGDQSVLISVVDTGVNMAHAEFGPSLLDPAVEFPGTNCDIANDDSSIEDAHGHGTFIAGQVIAQSNNGTAIAGAAPGISLFPVKISEDGSNEPLERIIAGCMLAHSLGAKIISLSWGGGGNEAMQAMTEQFAADGTLLVCSAGNYGNNFVTWPGAYPDAMAIGNSLPDDSRFITSSYGPALDLVAPGWNLTSLAPDDNNGLVSGGSGTSYATPLVSAAAALLWSARPELTLTEMRGLLETSGPLASGFGEGVIVKRLDMRDLFDKAVNPSIRITPPQRAVQHDSMQLSFELRGEPLSASLELDGSKVADLSGPDWQYELDLAGFPGGRHTLTAKAVFSESLSSDQLEIVVAGEAMQFPLAEHFTDGTGICSTLDLSNYDPAMAGELALQDYSGREEQLRSLGHAMWGIYEEPGAVPQYQLQIGLDGYGLHELDAVITQPVLVPETGSPTLSLEHRCNVTDVLQRILVSDDLGLSWQELLTTEGELPPMGGFILPHTRLEMDLAPYAGSEVVVMFLLAAESGSSAQWHDFEWGWWIDVLSFGDSGWIDLPVALLEDNDPLVYGSVPGVASISVSPGGGFPLATAQWWLDYPAFHIELPPDQRVTVSGPGPHGYTFELGEGLPAGNAQAILRLTVTDIHGNVSDELETPVWQYNTRGDVNADGLVNSLDNAALRQYLQQSLPFSPFADCNYDGIVDERDNAVIAYGWEDA